MISPETVTALAHLRATTGRTDLVDTIANELRVQDGLLSKQEATIGELWEANHALQSKLDDINMAMRASWWGVLKAAWNRRFKKSDVPE